VPIPRELVAFGELSLSGEVRNVSQPEARLKEASKLGFQQALLPKGVKQPTAPPGLTPRFLSHIHQLVSWAKQLKQKTEDTTQSEL
jgi:DNA repair protein RadA/Sms